MAARINIKEIAKKANVSIGTVDRVLHNRGRVAKETKERVLQIIKEGDYRSNVNARLLRLGKYLKIGVIIPDEPGYWSRHEKGIKSALESLEHLETRFFKFQMNLSSMELAIESAIHSELDGLILSPILIKSNSSLDQKIRQLNLPIILLDSKLSDWEGYLAFIGQHGFQSGYSAGHLLSLGMSEGFQITILNFLSSDEENNVIDDRIKGLKSYLKETRPDAQTRKINLEGGSSWQEIFENIDHAQHAVYVPNSKVYRVKDWFSDQRPRILGYDLIQKNVEMLKSGMVDFLIHQMPSYQASLAIDLMNRKLVYKREVVKDNFVPIEVVSRFNIDYVQH